MRKHPNSVLRGASNTNAVLDDRDVRAIKKLIGQFSLAEIARRFDVGESTVRRIRDGETWVHVT